MDAGRAGHGYLPVWLAPHILWERACSRWHRRRSTALPRRQHREQARSHKGQTVQMTDKKNPRTRRGFF
ncbi:hypothetical protein EU514_09670 [Pseudomonas fragi]|nr:hypothetical protein [Pseudomonas fragi]